MVFQSGVAAEGGGPHLTLTYAVAVVLVASVGTFACMLGLEVWNSVRFARKARSTRRASQASPALHLSPRTSASAAPVPVHAPKSGAAEAPGKKQVCSLGNYWTCTRYHSIMLDTLALHQLEYLELKLPKLIT
jgi:hypothetical protein